MLIFEYLNSSVLNVFEKKFIKSKYLAMIIIFLVSNRVILTFYTKYINIKLRLREKIYITKISIFSFNTILANCFLLMILIYKVVNRTLMVVQNF